MNHSTCSLQFGAESRPKRRTSKLNWTVAPDFLLWPRECPLSSYQTGIVRGQHSSWSHLLFAQPVHLSPNLEFKCTKLSTNRSTVVFLLYPPWGWTLQVVLANTCRTRILCRESSLCFEKSQPSDLTDVFQQDVAISTSDLAPPLVPQYPPRFSQAIFLVP